VSGAGTGRDAQFGMCPASLGAMHRLECIRGGVPTVTARWAWANEIIGCERRTIDEAVLTIGADHQWVRGQRRSEMRYAGLAVFVHRSVND
jgi:hypothetical protein